MAEAWSLCVSALMPLLAVHLITLRHRQGSGLCGFHTQPCHERLSMWESLKCIHAQSVVEARGHGNGCQGLVCLSELKTTFSVSLTAGMFELYNPAGHHT